MELGFQIAINNGISDSLSYIPDFKTKNLPDSGIPYMGWILGSTNSPVQFQVRNDRRMKALNKMPLFEVIYQSQITVKKNLLTGLYIIVYFQISGPFLLP